MFVQWCGVTCILLMFLANSGDIFVIACDICDITTLVNSKKMYLHSIYGKKSKTPPPHNYPNAFLHAKNWQPSCHLQIYTLDWHTIRLNLQKPDYKIHTKYKSVIFNMYSYDFFLASSHYHIK